MKNINNLRVGILQVPITRIILLILTDCLSVLMASVLGLYVRYDFQFADVPREFWEAALALCLPNILILCLVFWVFRLYNSVWRYASDAELLHNAIAVIICAVLQPILLKLLGCYLPRSFPFYYGFFLLLFTCGVRFSYRIARALQHSRLLSMRRKEQVNCMIIGGGAAGNAIIKEMESSSYLSMRAVCAIDDNPGCHGKYLRGVPIVGGREDILKSVEKYSVDEIIIAMPSASKQALKPILEICKETGCRMRILPGMYQIINGDVSVSKLREVQIEDLLGREPVQVNVDEIAGYVKDKVILVTGGGGSIGSELCRQIAKHYPKLLIIFDVYENNAYDIQQELKKNHPELNLLVLIGSVRDSRKVNQVFEKYKPEIVYHAAAHKHVPLMEDSPCEAIKNNAIGTYKTAYAAMMNGCERFVLISTDKAVNPTNIMGASKRLCEMIIQSFDRMIRDAKVERIPMLYAHADDEDGAMAWERNAGMEIKTEFVAVRFGNVLGSNGSVIPLFKKQIEEGGPVTVTHPDIIRYFMTIPEAVSLVLQAGTYAKGGEIFVLDMGSPMKIDTLARNLIKLSGLKPDVDIQIQYTGLRPGEKLYEEKLMEEEGMKTTPNQLIHIGCPIAFDTEEFLGQMQLLMKKCYANDENIRELVRTIVTTYHEG